MGHIGLVLRVWVKILVNVSKLWTKTTKPMETICKQTYYTGTDSGVDTVINLDTDSDDLVLVIVRMVPLVAQPTSPNTTSLPQPYTASASPSLPPSTSSWPMPTPTSTVPQQNVASFHPKLSVPPPSLHPGNYHSVAP